MLRIEINGEAPSVAQLHRAATINYGHFTSMQVRSGAVRGLDLHLARLAAATRELFGTTLEAARVRELIRHALAGERDASVRVTVFGGEGNLAVVGDAHLPDVMVTVSDAIPDEAQSGWRVRTAEYARELPHIKHVATMGLIRHWRLALADGFDDALFVDRGGRIGEGSAWNLVLWSGESFAWPLADQLAGITMQLLQAALLQRGVPSITRPLYRQELSSFRAALATYSICPAQPLTSIDAVAFTQNDETERILRTAWDTVPWDRV